MKATIRTGRLNTGNLLLRVVSLLLAVTLAYLSCTPGGAGKKSSASLPPAAWNIDTLCRALGACINLGNALEAPKEGEWGVVLKKSYFSHAKSLGFQSVRIPVRWSAHVDTIAPYAIDPAFMNRVLWAIDQALINNLKAIINVHHFEPLMSDPVKFSPVFISIWKQVAKRCASYGPELYFELCNEPNGAMSAAQWNELAGKALAVIRPTNPRRSVIIGGTEWNAARGLNTLTLPADSFIIATFHCYDPMQFTHQGASWVKASSMWKGIRWRASRCDTALLIAMFDGVDAWSKKAGVPMFLGEFGALDTADTISRVLYTAFIAKQAVERGWPYAYWKYNNNFGIYDDETNTTRDFLINALLKPESTFIAYQQLAARDMMVIPDPGSDLFLLLDDFEDSLPAQNSLVGIAGDSAASCCVWNVWYSDRSIVLNHNGDTIAVGSGYSGKLVDNRGRDGKCLYAKEYLNGSSYPSISLQAPFPGENNRNWYDLSPLTAISFYAKGFGLLTVDVITDTIRNGYPPSDNWGHFSCPFELADAWKQYVVPVKDLKPKPWSQPQQEMLDWSSGMKRAGAVSFTTHQNYGKEVDDSLEVFIDDIRLYGLTEGSFRPAGR
ncbi:MAG: cellulase family glycosylhydrolase [Chitinispirillaceae bacterium]|nr:cellulase family glycosylhydrolase [Chitinispirillaceae bacterium]